jgi:hypothetical protein
MNRLIQMAAAARWRLLISAAAHWVHANLRTENSKSQSVDPGAVSLITPGGSGRPTLF